MGTGLFLGTLPAIPVVPRQRLQRVAMTTGLIKVNLENGSMIWDKSYGGASYDYFDDALVQEDGSFIMVGLSYAASGNTGDRQSTAKGESSDLWVVKADANGSILWERSYGGEKGVGWDSRIIPLGGQGFLISSGASGQPLEIYLGDKEILEVRIAIIG